MIYQMEPVLEDPLLHFLLTPIVPILLVPLLVTLFHHHLHMLLHIVRTVAVQTATRILQSTFMLHQREVPQWKPWSISLTSCRGICLHYSILTNYSCQGSMILPLHLLLTDPPQLFHANPLLLSLPGLLTNFHRLCLTWGHKHSSNNSS